MPAAPPLVDLVSIEAAGLNASAAPGERMFDGWLLRFSPGKAKRARCVNAVATGQLSLAARLAHCEAAYAAAGLPLIVRVTAFSTPVDLDASLADMGMHRIDDTRVMVLPGLEPIDTPAAPQGLQWKALTGDALAHAVGALRGSTPRQREAHVARLRHSSVSWRGLALVDGDGETVACGQVAQEGQLAGLYDVFTAPAARGKGYARALCTRLLHLAHGAGARRAYLQVEGDNQAARTIYHGLGFADAYAYHYRTRDPQAA